MSVTSGSWRQKKSAPDEGHVPVLLKEVISYLRPKPGGRYLDGTLGLGGHAVGIMRQAEGQARLLGLDQDAAALAWAQKRLSEFGNRVTLIQSRFSAFSEAMAECRWDKLDGAVLDLGVSSLQLDQAERGFSFLQDGPLDMRMDLSSGGTPAAKWLARAGFEEIRETIKTLGEDPLAGRIAKAIVEAREKGPIKSTLELAGIVSTAYPPKMRATARNHPATRTFQAIRLKINNELGELADFLNRIADYLNPGARLAIISFHSLEDRIVKKRFREMSATCVCPPALPVCVCAHRPSLMVLTKKPVTAGADELSYNSRARSAKLRVAERLA